jgi:hypothetical protein
MLTLTLDSRMRATLGRLAGLALLLIGLACSDLPTPIEPLATRPVTTATAAEVVTSAEEIEDALTRVLPALSDAGASSGLRNALGALLDALVLRESSSAIAAVRSAEAVLGAYTLTVGPGSGDAAEIDAIGLALSSVGRRFGETR